MNPVNDQLIPIWIADYVLLGYGTGAIMAVPGHDERDFDSPGSSICQSCGWSRRHEQANAALERGRGRARRGRQFAVRPSPLDGLPTEEAKRVITAWLEVSGLGKGTVNYKLRDWLFSRQRYWGEPFPIVLDENDRTRATP